MEHILQFGINIDDEMIKKTVVDTASQQVVNSIRQDIMKQLTGNKKPTEWDYTSKLAERLIKTKVIKDMVNKAVSDLMD